MEEFLSYGPICYLLYYSQYRLFQKEAIACDFQQRVSFVVLCGPSLEAYNIGRGDPDRSSVMA